MSDDLTIELVNSVRSLETQVQSLAKGLGTAKTSVNDVGNAMKRSFTEAEQSAKRTSHEIYEAGHALAGMGGTLGEIAHATTGGFKFEGSLQGIAIGAAVAGVAFDVMKTAIAKNNAEIEQAIDLEQKLSNALRDASIKSAATNLAGSESQAGEDKVLASRLGHAGLLAAAKVAESGNGISLSDATRGMSEASFIHNQKARNAAIAAAQMAAGTGETSFTDAMSMVAKNRGLQARMASGHGNAEDLAARMIVHQQGLPPTKHNLDAARGEFHSDAHGFVKKANELIGIQNDIPLGQRHDIGSGAAGKAKEEQVGYAQNSQKLVVENLHREHIQAMEKNTAQANSLGGKFETFSARFFDYMFMGALRPVGHRPHDLFFDTPQDKAERAERDYKRALQKNGIPADGG